MLKIKKKWSKRVMRTVVALGVIGLIGMISLFSINGYVKASVKQQILTAEAAAELEDVDCILVLGCWVREEGVPSSMLNDRLDRGIELYDMGVSDRMLMSGDHGQTEYDEVNTMKQVAIDKGVPSQNIFMDHAGFSTYESMYRARDVFEAKKVVIVTQEYHLYRALYVAKKLGLEAYGVASDGGNYGGQSMRDLREVAARAKDFMTALFRPKPTFLGDAIPVQGNGDLTNDK